MRAAEDVQAAHPRLLKRRVVLSRRRVARHQDPADYTPDEHFRAIQAAGRGEDFAVETDDYRRYKADGLRSLGAG
jgi:hypothetical protein